MKNIKTLLLTAALALSAASAVADTIPFPYTTFPSGAPGTAGYTTNLANGWTNSTISTNTYQYWTNSPGFGTMVTTTNYVTNSVVTYADIDVSQQYDLTLMGSIALSAPGAGATTNRTLTLARVSSSGVVDGVNTMPWAMFSSGSNTVSTATNIIQWVGAFQKVRVVQDQWFGTNGLVMTNMGVSWERKRITPVLNSGR